MAAAFSADGQTLYYVERTYTSRPGLNGRADDTYEHALKSRDMRTGRERAIIPKPKFQFEVGVPSDDLARASLSPNGKTLLYGNATVDLATGVKQKGFEREGCGLTFTPDGKTLAANSGPFVSLYDYDTGRKLLFLGPITTRAVGGAIAPAFTPDLNKIVVPGGGEFLWVWDVSEVMKGRGAK